ncbi:hypothetical protein NA56DRAFT_483671 [Hyaloscypha hepaticicola]|jgi:hypothetical protein|uniref:Uncharacterized protein n=1 Tax=Hyaloscypha hepaticicola TaxID=2082293 RepID=A0A2J6PEM1_9HELO|nr:hypothetical protein NA56DRAFT_483671 [Hyaloscypha hepaticicola]
MRLVAMLFVQVPQGLIHRIWRGPGIGQLTRVASPYRAATAIPLEKIILEGNRVSMIQVLL